MLQVVMFSSVPVLGRLGLPSCLLSQGASFQESCPSFPGHQPGLSSASRFPGSLSGADECVCEPPVPTAGSASDSQVPFEGVSGKCPTAVSIPLAFAA